MRIFAHQLSLPHAMPELQKAQRKHHLDLSYVSSEDAEWPCPSSSSIFSSAISRLSFAFCSFALLAASRSRMTCPIANLVELLSASPSLCSSSKTSVGKSFLSW